ncbi:hypothetical protein DL770_005243 [Monosporascus sp. CRB-9-2]|nr:hypothetical protein DL770_005243 [Monosporascus sp. CRB-9-2]
MRHSVDILDNGRIRDLAALESLPYDETTNGGVWCQTILKDSAAPKAFKILLVTAAAAVPDLETITIDKWEVVEVADFGSPLTTWTRLGRHFFANTVDKDRLSSVLDKHRSPPIRFYAPTYPVEILEYMQVTRRLDEIRQQANAAFTTLPTGGEFDATLLAYHFLLDLDDYKHSPASTNPSLRIQKRSPRWPYTVASHKILSYVEAFGDQDLTGAYQNTASPQELIVHMDFIQGTQEALDQGIAGRLRRGFSRAVRLLDRTGLVRQYAQCDRLSSGPRALPICYRYGRVRKYKHEYAHRNLEVQATRSSIGSGRNAPTRYVTWRFYGTYQAIPGFTAKDVECWMSFMEQLVACAFQTLSTLFLSSKRGALPTVSTSWTPQWLVAEEVGLNQKLPICQNTDFGNRFGGLANSTDPEVKELFLAQLHESITRGLARAHANIKENKYQNQARGTKEPAGQRVDAFMSSSLAALGNLTDHRPSGERLGTCLPGVNTQKSTRMNTHAGCNGEAELTGAIRTTAAVGNRQRFSTISLLQNLNTAIERMSSQIDDLNARIGDTTKTLATRIDDAAVIRDSIKRERLLVHGHLREARDNDDYKAEIIARDFHQLLRVSAQIWWSAQLSSARRL